MPRELVNANITHVSYVDKGANQKQFFFTKSDKQPDFKKEVKLFINKDDEDQQLVYGVVYEPDVEDSHEDFMTAPEIEKAAHGFMKDARNIDKQHDFESGVGEVVESYIAPAEFQLGEETITKGSWVLVTKASDEVWEEVKKGEITGYSMAGTAETIKKQKKEKPVSKSENDEEMKGFFDLLKSFFAKGEVRDRYEDNQKRRNLWAVWDGMEDTFYESLWDNRTPDVADFERLETGVQDFLEILQEIKSSGDVLKALKEKPETIGKGEGEMKKEDIEKLLDDKLNPITKRLDAIDKEDQGEGQESIEGEEDDVLKQLSSVLDEKLSPITKRLETVEKARGISKQADQDENNQEPVKKHYLEGIL
ncbi:Putative phage serine protease XkdF [Gracilibacillus orientalis]|uniref:Putative phage serine protease XkdF n=1 Tax=Gracilibacillus orientalis TaxID=334253 RepID=A0A1I4PN28_9BACI|nr:XkdF-like putative serine protease domain-containing protein [Gracilibacillus orientalis]SFM29016.1 Putative phage serine protease XkdF [Gracilibacillus orientalis]